MLFTVMETNIAHINKNEIENLDNLFSNLHPLFKAWFPYSPYRSLSVVDGLSRPFGVSGSLGIIASRWRSFREATSLSWSLMVFQVFI